MTTDQAREIVNLLTCLFYGFILFAAGTLCGLTLILKELRAPRSMHIYRDPEETLEPDDGDEWKEGAVDDEP